MPKDQVNRVILGKTVCLEVPRQAMQKHNTLSLSSVFPLSNLVFPRKRSTEIRVNCPHTSEPEL